MLIWSPKGRAAAGVVASVLFIVFFFLPLAVILMSSLSQQWNGILPSGFTLNHFVNALHGAAWDALLASLTIGFCASLFALLCGVWAALALRQYGVKTQKWLSMVFYLPSAIPSVSVGLGILVAFSQGPLQMNGTLWIVLTAHFVLISAFTFSNVSTGLARISADIENVASSLGGIAWYRLRHVTLPLLMPWMVSALALSLSLSMGELGATMMIYPPGWTTLPVAIFSLTDRGNIADGAALTIVLVAITLLLMMKLERIAKRLGRNKTVGRVGHSRHPAKELRTIHFPRFQSPARADRAPAGGSLPRVRTTAARFCSDRGRQI
ncbi:phosphonate ABC transporter permease [Salmonella enterica subsp. enterica serovar Daytona]|uniref:Putative 2-aminoethylphosphonate transport system permease protein PhnV n=2 Tax=Salmonella enterica TaxID=28901 RepID=A0A447JMC3_SALET|nr:phosphonate ABC transporter permease [Salmonella enterica subsp. enterica serovar Daytona]